MKRHKILRDKSKNRKPPTQQHQGSAHSKEQWRPAPPHLTGNCLSSKDSLGVVSLLMSSLVVLVSPSYLICLLGNNCGVSLQVAKFAWSNLRGQWRRYTRSFTFFPSPKLFLPELLVCQKPAFLLQIQTAYSGLSSRLWIFSYVSGDRRHSPS